VTTQDVMQIEQRLLQAISLHQIGQMQNAERLYREILLDHPDHPEASHHLGAAMLENGRVDASLPFFKAALEVDPQQEQYWLSYIGALIQATHYEDAKLVLSYGLQAGLSGQEIDALIDVLENSFNEKSPVTQASTSPFSDEDALIKLFAELRYEEVEEKTRAILQNHPNWLVGWKILSDTLLVQKKDARLPALMALELNLNDAKEHCYYGLVLKSQGDLKGAVGAFEQAIELKADYAAAYNNLGIVRKDMGDIEAAIRSYRRALELNPGYASCYSNLLFCLSHSEEIDTQALFEEHYHFGLRYELPLKALWQKHTNQRDPERCLQVGFVSADFRDHSLAYFIEPLLNYLMVSSKLSLHAYASSDIEDDVTQRLHGKFRYWNRVYGLSDEMFTKKIREDNIDILIDLDGHTAGNRLLTFARKPAPIQVSWLGYLATTGLTAMDYYLADGYLLPVGKLDDQFTENLVQLPANAPFMPSALAPDVNDLPALKNGYITFACFNQSNKITRSVVRLWCKLLSAIPDSKMLLGAMPLDGSYDALAEWFAVGGVSNDRLIFHPRSSMDKYLKLYHQVDICLDTFPSNGVTTTFHAMWMGVPTLCVEGERLASRGALGVMRHVGLDDFVALDESDFVSKGLFLVNHIEQLVEVRQSLRGRFELSLLAQPNVIAESLEQAFLQMWKRFCKQLPAEPFQIQVIK
jgi:tetratricopeptide (TPR) repeat protein